MAVRLLLGSGTWRVVGDADGAHRDGGFFMITRSCPHPQPPYVVLTLLATEVVMAEVHRDGVPVDYVLGAGKAPTT
jgi:hypothetical protein